MITFGFIIEIYIQERALILENIAYSCNCKIEDRKLDVQPRLSVRQSVYLSVYLFIYPSVKSPIPRNQNQIKSRSLVRLKTGPQGVWGSGENGYLFWHCLGVRYRTPRLRGYGSGTGHREQDSSPTRQFTDTFFEDSSPTDLKTVHRHL